MEAVAEKKGASRDDGQFLTFVLSEEEYGVEILKVREIMGIMEITPVPQTPDYMKGVINLRGSVIPIVDLRLKFAMPEVEHTKETCIIVAEVGATQVGVIVDSVSEVMDIKGEDIEEAPNFGQEIDTNFIMGLGKTKKKIVILLDIEKVLTTDELKMVEQIAKK